MNICSKKIVQCFILRSFYQRNRVPLIDNQCPGFNLPFAFAAEIRTGKMSAPGAVAVAASCSDGVAVVAVVDVAVIDGTISAPGAVAVAISCNDDAAVVDVSVIDGTMSAPGAVAISASSKDVDVSKNVVAVAKIAVDVVS